MKHHLKPFLFFTLILTLVGLACMSSVPTEAPATLTPIPTELSAIATLPASTHTPLPTERPTDPPPTATATPDPIPSIFSYTFISGGLVDFSEADLTFDFLTPGVLYAGREFEQDYQSEDGGVTWQPAPFYKDDLPYEKFADARIFDVRRDPHNPTTLYGRNDAMESFAKSIDGGENWVFLSTPFSIYNLSWDIDPHNPGTLFVANVSTIYKSTDGGETWRVIDAGFPKIRYEPFFEPRLIFDPSQSNIIYFLDRSGWGLHRSTQGGEQWENINPPEFIKWLVVDPQNLNTLIGGNTEHLYKSVDAGKTWQIDRLGLPGETVIQSLAIDPSNPANWYAILQDGVGKLYKSEDGGQSWREITASGYHAYRIRQVGVDPSGALFIAQGSRVLKTTDGGASWNPVFQTDSGWNFQLVVDSQTPNTLFVVTNREVHQSSDGGASWAKIFSGSESGSLNLYPQSPGVLYLTDAHQLSKSMDGGQTWQTMGALEEEENFSWLAVDPQTPSMLYAASSAWVDSNTRYTFYKSADGGQTWQPANFGLPEEPYVTQFMVDPHTPTTLFAVDSGELYKSTDGGQTWNSVGAGLPEDNTANVETLVADPMQPGLLYAAIYGHGVYRSLDGGETWKSVSPEPPTLTFHSLIIDPSKPNTLYATSVEGLWVIQP